MKSHNATEFILLKYQNLFDSNHPDKVKELNDHIKKISLVKTENLFREAKNFLVIKSLHLTDDIEKLSHEILTIISDEIIDFEIYMDTNDRSYYRRATRDHKVVKEKVNELKILLRKNLTPQPID